jgi:hypothetical protein
MAITPIDFSLLANNQRSDLSKVASDDFLRIQQQQIASVMEQKQEEHQYETKQIQPAADLVVNTEAQGQRQQEQGENARKPDVPVSEETKKSLENVEYVSYDDPNLGKALDWSG